MNWLAHLAWLLSRWLRGPATRWRYCVGCGQHSLLQTERTQGIWRPWLCPDCETADRIRRAA